MSIQNILVSTLLMCQLGIHNFIQAEIIHGMDFPILDRSGIVGKWYQLTSVEEHDSFACTINVYERLSENEYRVNAARILPPVREENIPSTSISMAKFSGISTFRNDSVVAVTRYGESTPWLSIIFDYDPNSHFVTYATTDKKITSSTSGLIFIFGRGKELPPGIIGRTKQSNIYKNGVRSDFKLYPSNTNGCVE